MLQFGDKSNAIQTLSAIDTKYHGSNEFYSLKQALLESTVTELSSDCEI